MAIDESPTRHFAGCRSSSPDLENAVGNRERIPSPFITVNSRLSVSGGWPSRHSTRWVTHSTYGKSFDFENVAVPCTTRTCWFLKCISQGCDCANNITRSSVDLRRLGLERSNWPSWHRI